MCGPISPELAVAGLAPEPNFFSLWFFHIYTQHDLHLKGFTDVLSASLVTTSGGFQTTTCVFLRESSRIFHSVLWSENTSVCADAKSFK